MAASLDKYPRMEIKTKADKKAGIETQTILVDEFVEVRGWKAIGQKINTYDTTATALWLLGVEQNNIDGVPIKEIIEK